MNMCLKEDLIENPILRKILDQIKEPIKSCNSDDYDVCDYDAN